MKKPTGTSAAAITAKLKELKAEWKSTIAALKKMRPAERAKAVAESAAAMATMNFLFTGVHELPRFKDDSAEFHQSIEKAFAGKR